MPPRLETPRQKRLRRAFPYASLGAATVVGLHVAWNHFEWGGPVATLLFTDLVWIPVIAAVAAACFMRARLEQDPRTAWTLIGLGALSWGAGQVVWAYHEIVLADEVPFPSLADVGYLGLLPLVGAGLLAFSSPTRRLSDLRRIMDGAVMATALLFVFLAIFVPLIDVPDAAPLERAIALAYPLGDVILATLLTFTFAHARTGHRTPLHLLGAGLAVFLAADISFAITTAQGTYMSGALIDNGWLAGLLLIGLAAVYPDPYRHDDHAPAQDGLAPILVYAPTVAALAVTVLIVPGRGGLDAPLALVGVLSVALIVAREVLNRREVQSLSTDLRRAYRELQRSEESRLQIMSSITHDIRTPLTPMRIQLRLLRMNGQDAPRRERSLTILERNMKNLERLVGDMIDIARLQDGRFQVDNANMDLTPHVQTIHDIYRPIADPHGIGLACRVTPELRILGDPTRIDQVLHNLLSNAIRFTPDGGRIDIQAQREGSDVVVRVTDTGRGLTTGEIDRLFRPFSQVHAQGESREKGSGLGLYISSEIAAHLGGSLTVTSPGRDLGATFTLTLPAADAPGLKTLQGRVAQLA